MSELDITTLRRYVRQVAEVRPNLDEETIARLVARNISIPVIVGDEWVLLDAAGEEVARIIAPELLS